MRTLTPYAAVAVLSALLPLAHASSAYSESVSGDLSNVGTSPTFLAMSSGSNTVMGNTGASAPGVVDRDYFTFTVPVGFLLTAVTVLPGTTIGNNQSFIGMQAGNQVTVDPTGGSATGLLGYTLYKPSDIGANILPRIGTGAGAIGFVGALAAGDYAVWIQETTVVTTSYGFDFTISAVPEPAAALLMLAGVAGIVLRRRRR